MLPRPGEPSFSFTYHFSIDKNTPLIEFVMISIPKKKAFYKKLHNLG